MPYSTKRKSQLRNLTLANQAKRAKLDGGGITEGTTGEVTGTTKADASVQPPCTLLPSNDIPYHNPSSPKQLQKHANPKKTNGIQIVIDPYSPRLKTNRRRVRDATEAIEAFKAMLPPRPVVLESGSKPDSIASDKRSCINDPTKAPPSLANAELALRKVEKLLNPPRDTGAGYKPCKLGTLIRNRCESMATCLRFYLHTSAAFIDASEKAAIGAGRGKWHACRIRQWVQRLIETGDIPVNKYGKQNTSVLEDEDISSEIKLHLWAKGKYITAEDIVRFLGTPEAQHTLGLSKSVSVKTARRWLRKMGYSWKTESKGQYFDGHERNDVVEFRQNVFIPKWKALEPFAMSWGDNVGIDMVFTPRDGRRNVIVWFHDESTFYAHDRRRLRWIHVDEDSIPVKKGEGVSVMVADFVSAEYGFLRSHDGKSSARKILYAGINRDGYLTNDDICEQFRQAVELVQREYPDQDHVFVYDNARIHTKVPTGSPSARHMTKFESDFGVQTVDSKGQQIKIQMKNSRFPDGSEQQLYLPNGRFKGMAALLRERGYDPSRLKAECRTGIKCDDVNADCCCRRILFNLIDVKGGQKSVLELLAESLGTQVMFLPKYHCELNPIEQCWGYAKRIYRLSPPSSRIADVERNMLRALEEIPISSIRRFTMKSRRFIDAYAQGLDGPNAAASEWARKKFKSHRTTPENVLA